MPRTLTTLAVVLGVAAAFAAPSFGQAPGPARLSTSASPATKPIASPAPAAAASHKPTALVSTAAEASVGSQAFEAAAVHHRKKRRALARVSHSPDAVAEANAAAKIQPTRAGYLGAMQVYPFSDGGLYQLYTAPGEITDIALQPGEVLAGTGPVAAGDTVRWIIGDTESGTGATKRIHILVKPTAADLATNLVINTDRRTYHIELRATPATYMASVTWTYPQDELIAIRAHASPVQVAEAAVQAAALVASGVDVEALNFRYRISGDKPTWRPVRVFDDGRQTFIQFPDGIAQGDMPPLWVTGPTGAELVNYRVHGQHMVVDRLFAAAELRLGGKHQQVVRLIRDSSGRARS